MKDIRRIISGRNAKRRGDVAENILHSEAIRTGWTVVKIPLGCRQVSAVKLLRVASAFDFVCIKGSHVIFIDSKTTKSKSFAFSAQTEHQVRILRDIEKHGHASGYVVNFTTLKKTVFYKASQLWALRAGASLKPEDGIHIGNDRIINLSRIFDQDSTLTHSDASIIK